MKKLTVGIVAHVDAGKTTCIEAMLYQSGKIRKLGRVDKRDTVLDYDEQERDHGITIYSKEAYFDWKDTRVFVLDTPGHVDFSAEMERVLQVLDLAVILINGQDGVQSHTRTIWKCLEHYGVPCVVFVNKMDISHFSEDELMENLEKNCSDACVRWDEERFDKLAMVEDTMLDQYMETGTIESSLVRKAVMERKCFPVFFGSALKLQGVDALMDMIADLAMVREYPQNFGARVYKISEDTQGNRLTHMRITGGVLHAKEKLEEDEKVDQIRLYSGGSFESLNEAEAGMVVAVKGLKKYESGQGLGFEEDRDAPILNAFLNYRLVVPQGANVLVLADTCRELASEDPQLEISVDEKTKNISVQIMGEMQMEVLRKKIQDRCGITVGFSTGSIVYEETIQSPVDGAGHFEPLRHYAEVHVRLEPLERGSGIQVVSACSSDMLSPAWQRSILSALSRKRHRGVLTGSFLTDVKIILTAGRGHIKHTEGGDFRQAACRAVRQALMKADNVILEPFYQFELELPSDSLSRALYDLEMRKAKVEVSDCGNGDMRITGRGPVRTLTNYQSEVTAYTKGRGIFSCTSAGYDISDAAEEIIESIGYEAEADLRNPADSVFCANGSGYNVPWDKSDEYMHIQIKDDAPVFCYQNVRYKVSEADLGYIMEMTSGRNRNSEKVEAERHIAEEKKKRDEENAKVKASAILPGMMIVDGYNMIYSWEELQEIAQEDLYAAREKLITALFNYQPYRQEPITVVFDGYKVKESHGAEIHKKDLTIVYTKSGQTADAWIESAAYRLKGKYKVTYVTSDGLIQNSILSQGGIRMSARELEKIMKQHKIIS